MPPLRGERSSKIPKHCEILVDIILALSPPPFFFTKNPKALLIIISLFSLTKKRCSFYWPLSKHVCAMDSFRQGTSPQYQYCYLDQSPQWFLLRNTGVGSDFTQNFWVNSEILSRLGALIWILSSDTDTICKLNQFHTIVRWQCCLDSCPIFLTYIN